MTEKVGKRFSNVRYWRYVFTPILFMMMIFGLFILYNSGSNTTTANFTSMTNILRKNVNTQSVNSALSQIQKYTS